MFDVVKNLPLPLKIRGHLEEKVHLKKVKREERGLAYWK